MSRTSPAALSSAPAPLRMVAAIAAALLVAIGLATATPSAASAAEESTFNFEWRTPSLVTDVNGNARPDPGDEVRYGVYWVLTGPATQATVTAYTFLGVSYVDNDVYIAGTTRGISTVRTVGTSDLDSLGGGPHYGPGSVTYTIDGVSHTSVVSPPPVIYTAPAPLSAVTTVERVGSTGAHPIEGDRLRYNTTVTNAAAVAVTLTGGSNLGVTIFPTTLNPGQTRTFNGAVHEVTYDDMVAGSIPFDDASLNWSAPDVSGTLAIPLATVATEPYRFAVDAGVDVVVSNPTGTARVDAHDAVAGDRLDYTFRMTNTGNVTVDWVSMSHRPVGTSFDLSTSSSGHKMAPGESLTDAGWVPANITSLPSGGGYFTPHVLTEDDLDLGYVDLAFRLRAQPAEELTSEERDDPKYRFPITVRTLFRDFTTSATITANRTLNDANGDGYGQPGETVTYSWRVVNTSDQAITLTRLVKRDFWTNVVTGVGADAPDGAVIAEGGELTGTFTYTLTTDDLDNGGRRFDVLADIKGNADGATVTKSAGTSVVYVNEYEAPNHRFTASGAYGDDNGDGNANVGETVTVKVSVENWGSYPLTGIVVNDGAGADVTGLLPAFPTSIASYDDATRTFTHVLTAADLTRGHFSYAATLDADGASRSTATSSTIPVVAYVAPATTLDTTATYDDANGDGFASLGETVTFTTTVANTGAWPLTGLTVGDAAGADVTGLLPAFSSTIAAGTSETQTFTHVLTAADFARGSLWYGTEMTATGMPTTQSGTSVTLTGITFQAYATDLDAISEGDVSVCVGGAPATEITLGTGVMVSPGGCSYPGDADGFRVVAFSTPMLLGTDTFNVTVPGSLGAGDHRLALYAPDGTLVGWKSITAKDPVAFAGLAFTGFAGLPLGGLAVTLILLGTAAILRSRERRQGAVTSEMKG
ncbi:hypothetical protein LGT39_08480 [Demequina sp. TTPB684]|uniref:DUF7507 domain-containing protein n=1 Tax=unclassified Demequina TaxID=2620311 RepID=UPI001CF0F838|nr:MULTISPECIES: hypothetical protein [unclassified Demequina]MCB2412880.1 hypothetical protein [Demequina sp. TTPB684]UPU88141.1 hypothetical protein LGT36_012975 [Demequina sp. TMPB413]